MRRLDLRMTLWLAIAWCLGGAGTNVRAAARDFVPAPTPPGGGITTGLDSCETLPPGFQPTWERNTAVLLNKLLAGGTQGLPPGVVIESVTITPNPGDIDTNESIGYYESFLMQSTYPTVATLSIPDGIFLTTGDLVDEDHELVERCNDTSYWCGLGYLGQGVDINDDPGDQDIQELYAAQIRPPSYDAVALNLRFTSDASIAGLHSKSVMASDLATQDSWLWMSYAGFEAYSGHTARFVHGFNLHRGFEPSIFIVCRYWITPGPLTGDYIFEKV